MLVDFQGDWPDGERVQVVTVTNEGERIHLARFYRFGQRNGPQLLTLKVGLDDIDHIEFQPFVDRDRFFFQGVQLPKTSMAAFSDPPRATVTFDEVDKKVRLDAYLPLKVSMELIEGRATGVSSGTFGQNLTRVEPDEGYSTLVTRLDGIGSPIVRATIQGTSRTRGSGTASGACRVLRYEAYEAPAEDLKAVDVNLPNPDPAQLLFPN
ncbi:MAG: hypothetical protein AAF497_24160 [Planctomycetota bacterium]